MPQRGVNNRTFLQSALLIILGAGLIGFALKFTTYFDNWYWLPWWPNMGDAVFIAVAGIVLLLIGIPKELMTRRSR